MRTIQRGDLVRTADGYLALVLARRGESDVEGEDDVLTVFRGNGLETDEPASSVQPMSFLHYADAGRSPASFAEVLAPATQGTNRNRNRNHCP